jgi:DNA-binding GntR family transcriptional regulator
LEAIERQDVEDAQAKVQALIERASRRLRATIEAQDQGPPGDGIPRLAVG